MHIAIDIKTTLKTENRHFPMDISFKSEDPFIILTGPSGAGKTMTLQMIAGIVKPESGYISVDKKVLFNNKKAINKKTRDRSVGYLFQDYALFPHMTVRNNLATGLRRKWFHRLSEKDEQEILDFLSLFEIEALADSLPCELSGGQKQRVGLARALISRPEILLLDEPFAALDNRLRKKLRMRLYMIQEQFGIPIVMITHDPQDVAYFSGTQVLYHSGHARIKSNRIWEYTKPVIQTEDKAVTAFRVA